MGTFTVEAKNGARNISSGKDREKKKSIFTFGKDSQVGFNNFQLDRRSFINEAKELEKFHWVLTKVQLEKVYTDLLVHIDMKKGVQGILLSCWHLFLSLDLENPYGDR